jgi:predicted metalloprotease with PDZ domain
LREHYGYKIITRAVRALTMAGSILWATNLAGQNATVKLEVDASEAPKRILHAHLQIPAQAGPLTLLYPKWLPGEHGPNGPITDLVGIQMSADGRRLEWRRQPDDMFAFDVQVPSGVRDVEVALDFLSPPNTGQFSSGASATAQLVDLSWNEVLLYPKGARASQIQYAARLKLPEGWHYGTALSVTNQAGPVWSFSPVSLERLVDSPVIAGAHFRTVELTPGENPRHFLHIVADSSAALDLKAEDQAHFTQLVAETGALFGARHYRSYHFLLTLSDYVAHFGLEHHESSDNREGERYLIDEEPRKLGAFLLPHEMTHSWNGKYRRPVGLATPDFHQPMNGELLWIYEGLTDYLGCVLATRCGLWTPLSFREYLALEAARLDREGGRKWRPLVDTTVAAQLLYMARPEGASRRRGVDFYQEGDLIWLEADVLIRQQSQGQRSLKDFCKRFYGGQSGPPSVVPYTLDNVIATLKEISSQDWKQFFQARVYAANPRAPLGGIEGAGWRITYTNTISEMLKLSESADKDTDLTFSLGFLVKEDGQIQEVIPGSPADKAGVAPAMRLVAVNNRRWTAEILRAAVRAAKTNTAPIELLVENEDYFVPCKLDYHDGERYPMLERDADKPDLLTDILKPLATPP